MLRIGLNGFGRVGRQVVRQAAYDRRGVEVVAVNARADAKTCAHLLAYDSVHGPFKKKVGHTDDTIIVGGKKIMLFHGPEPASIPWSKAKVDIVLETTGRFKDKAALKAHLKPGVKRVIVSVPGKGLDATFVYGVNHTLYDPAKHKIVSNASCTTNCLAPLVKVLHEAFGIEKGIMTTIHSYTMSQRILDGSRPDLRRARAAAVSMIPTSTGAAKTVTQVIPELAGRLDGFSIRVPTPNVSIVDFTCHVAKKTTAVKVNQALKRAAARDLKGIMAYTEVPLVSVDYTSSTYSAIIDGPLTQVMGDDLVKVLAWYDNEAGYSARLVDLAYYMATR